MKSIIDIAGTLREDLGIPLDIIIDPLDLLRRARIAGVIKNFSASPKLQSNDAHWNAEIREISFSQNIWNEIIGVCSPETRFTVFHEIGHAVLGHSSRYRLSRRPQFGRTVEPDEADSDEFAAAFGIPEHLARGLPALTIESFASTFGLPPDLIGHRVSQLQKLKRRYVNPLADVPYDDYGAALSQMRRNPLNWNS